MKEILIKIAQGKLSEGLLTKKESTTILDTFNTHMEEGYSQEEAVYICLKKIDTLITKK